MRVLAQVQAVAEELREMGTEAFFYVCNVADRDEVYRTAEQVRKGGSERFFLKTPLVCTDRGVTGNSALGNSVAATINFL